LIGCRFHQSALLRQVSDGAIPSSIVSLCNPVIALLQICIHTSAVQGSRAFAHMKSWSSGKLRRCQLIPVLCGLSCLLFQAAVIDTGRDTCSSKVSIDGFPYHCPDPLDFPSTRRATIKLSGLVLQSL